MNMKNVLSTKSLQTALWTALLAGVVGISACSSEPQEGEADVIAEEQSSAVEPTDMDSGTEDMTIEETAPVGVSEPSTELDSDTTTDLDTDTTVGMDTGTDIEESMIDDTDTDTDSNTTDQEVN